MKQRILFFDYWMKGFHNISAIMEHLDEDYEFYLLHLSSLQGIHEDSKQIKDGVNCYDISYFNAGDLGGALNEIKPDVVITFNTTYIFDRAICLEAKKAGIKLIFLQHGSRKTIQKKNTSHAKSRNYSKLFDFQTIKKNLSYIRYYLNSKNKDMHGLMSSFIVVFEYFFLPRQSKFFPYFANECLANFCCVYSTAEKPYYLDLGYKENQIIVVGNPKFYKRPPFNHPKPYILFIDEGLPEAGNYYDVTTDKREAVLQRAAESLKGIGFDLLVKPHPLAKESNFLPGNYTIINEDLANLISGSNGCICNVSTAGDHVILENKILISLSDSEFLSVPKPYVDDGAAVLMSSADLATHSKIRLPDGVEKYRIDNVKTFDSNEFMRLI